MPQGPGKRDYSRGKIAGVNRVISLLAIGGGVILGCGLLLAGACRVQGRLIYFPDHHLPHPSAAGLPGVQAGHIRTADGLSLAVWYAPPEAGNFVVLYLHGNAGNIAYRARRIIGFAELGWGILLPEYRGYGGNPGTPSERGLLLDARAALAQLSAMGIAPERILVWGESLGTGLAVQLAAEHDVACLLLESPYTSMADLARWHLPWLPVGPWLRDRFDSLRRIGAVRAPVLIMQGDRDAVVPPEMGRRLLAAARAPGELWHAAGAGHNDLADFGMLAAAADFVRRRCTTAPGSSAQPDH
jgi:fermentation-respiration switch protein FrsA (DUF1100 family)